MRKFQRSSEICMPNTTPMEPWAFLNARKFPTIDRCFASLKNIDEYKSEEFTSFRNFDTENYKYTFPQESNGLTSFALKNKLKSLPDRISVDELDLLIREKLQKERYSIQVLFNSEDNNKRGFITKEALMRIFLSISPFVKIEQFYKLLERYDLNLRSVITFKDFEKAFSDPPKGNFQAPKIFYGTGHPYNVTSAFGLQLFREAALEKDFDLKEIIPPSCFEANKRVLMPQLREGLLKIQIHFCDEDFIRFWNKLDKEGVGSIPLQKLLDVLNLQDDGTPMCGIRHISMPKKRPRRLRVLRPKCPLKYIDCYKKHSSQDLHAGGVSFPIVKPHCWFPKGPGGTNDYEFGYGSSFAKGLDFIRKQRPRFASIFHTLQYIFEEPYQHMKNIFEKLDTKKSGYVPLCTGLKILCEYDFNVELPNFEKFLQKNHALDVNNGMNYRKLLMDFQTKGFGTLVNRGMDQILIGRNQASGLQSLTTMSVEEIEKKLLEILHWDFLNFKEMLDKCSPDKEYILDTNLRNAIEKILGYPMTEEQWQELQYQFEYNFDVGDENKALVKYKSFLEKFNKPTNICRYRTDKKLDVKSKLYEGLYRTGNDVYDPPRDYSFVCRLVADTLKKYFHRIDKQYKTFKDTTNGKLTKETLMELLNNQGCQLTPQEMNVIWAVLETNHYYKRMRFQEIMKILMTRLYERADQIAEEKRRSELSEHPPNTEYIKILKDHRKTRKEAYKKTLETAEKRIEKSRGLKQFTSDPVEVKLILQKIMPHIKSIWKEFKKQIRKVDIMGHSYIEYFDMKSLLIKNSFDLSENEINQLLHGFDLKNDGRFFYVNFLEEFIKMQFNDGSAKPALHFDRVRHILIDKKTGSKITITDAYKNLRKHLLTKWKSLIRAFRRIDTCKSGKITINQLNGVLKEAGMHFNRDDLFHLFTGFDVNLDGYIDYVEFTEQLLDVFVPHNV